MQKIIFTLLSLLFLNLNAQNAFIQFLNNSADVEIEEAKIFVDDIEITSLEFRLATPYISFDATGSKFIKVDVFNQEDSLILSKENLFIEEDKNYLCILQGVMNADNYRSNPDGENISLNILWVENAIKDSLPEDSAFQYLFIHGVSDAPLVDIGKDSITIFNDVIYGDAEGYIEIEEQSFNLHVLSSDGSITLYSYKTDFDNNKIPVVLFLSGFLVSSANQNGAFFELFALLPDGSVISLANITRRKDDIFSQNKIVLFPNPTNNILQLKFENQGNLQDIRYSIYSVNGKLVSQPNQTYNKQINVSDYPSGMYFLELMIDKDSRSFSFMKH
jgi:hypothetical protein